MNSESSTPRYGTISVSLHWFMLLLIAAVYACIEFREQFPKGSDARETLKAWHFTLGLSVFVLAWVRVAFRNIGARPPTGAKRSIEERLATVVHVALYLLMLSMPILGWLTLSADEKPIPFFGLDLPPLIKPNEQWLEVLEETHETIGTVGYVLIAGHALAALYHHYVKRDHTLIRMLPQRQ